MRFSTWRILPLIIAFAMLIGINQVGAMDQDREFPHPTLTSESAQDAPYFYQFKPAASLDR